MGGPGGPVAADVLTGPTTPAAFARAVLDAVERIPPGRVLTYGDAAEYVGAPRRHRAVGAVLAASGHEVPWWRVVLATGDPAPSSPAEALRLLGAEGCPLRGARVDLARARWDGRPMA